MLRRLASWLLARVVGQGHVDGDRNGDAPVRVHDERTDLDGWCDWCCCVLPVRGLCDDCRHELADERGPAVAIDPTAMRERAEAWKHELN